MIVYQNNSNTNEYKNINLEINSQLEVDQINKQKNAISVLLLLWNTTIFLSLIANKKYTILQLPLIILNFTNIFLKIF